MRTVILCGGKGTRAYPLTLDVPKPLLEIDGQPVLRQVMDVYAAQGFSDFVLAAGYKIELIEAFVADVPPAWRVEVVDTGEDTNTGGRVLRCRDLVDDTFFVTYADGVGNVNLEALLEFHRGHAGLATLTTVPLPSQYGTIVFNGGGRVTEFREKPQLLDHHINAGYFVFDREAFDHWGGEDLENEVLPSLGAAGRLFAFRHQGFWRSMDTYKDALELTRLSASGNAPWRAAPPPG
jgi:glucose-1-phosphate cytidylyltransferase